MVNEATMQKLRELRLGVMSETCRRQMNDPSIRSLSFGERLGLAVEAEWSSLKSNKLSRLILPGFPLFSLRCCHISEILRHG
jgi:hypothetical protein